MIRELAAPILGGGRSGVFASAGGQNTEGLNSSLKLLEKLIS